VLPVEARTRERAGRQQEGSVSRATSNTNIAPDYAQQAQEFNYVATGGVFSQGVSGLQSTVVKRVARS
jgi:hypothetical protein